MDPDETDTNEIDIDIDEVEADAEDEDELDENEPDSEDDEDCGSVENDENLHQYNGFHRANHISSHNINNNRQNSSHLKRQKLDLTNGSSNNHNNNNNNNKPTKKVFNIKNEMYKNSHKNSAGNMLNRQNNMSDFNQQRHIVGAAGIKSFGFNNNNNNKNNSYKNQNKSEQQQQARSLKNGANDGANVVKSSKKFSVKSESVSRNLSHNNGSYFNSLNYDESSNHSSKIWDFVSLMFLLRERNRHLN